MNPDEAVSGEGLQFLRIAQVQARAGLSRTEIYRRMKDDEPELNPFPPSRPYRGRAATKGVFWVEADLRAWQLAEMGLAEPPFPNWPSAQLGCPE